MTAHTSTHTSTHISTHTTAHVTPTSLLDPIEKASRD